MSFCNLWLNRFLRIIVMIFFSMAQLFVWIFLFIKIVFYRITQLYLYAKYELSRVLPGHAIDQLNRLDGFLVYTSGSSGNKKAIYYNDKRVKEVKSYFMLSILSSLPFSFSLKTFFILSAIDSDNSLTDVMTTETGQLNRFQMLQAPYRLLHTDEFKPHLAHYDHQALRLWLFMVTRPRYLYATNPSSLVLFHQSLSQPKTFYFIRDFIDKKLSNQKELELLYEKIKDVDVDFKAILEAKPDNLLALNPKLKGHICWDGGYVRPYLERFTELYPKLRHYPLFSMSTENIETVSFFKLFLPLAPKTVYEFKQSDEISFPWELVPGQEYEMLISNPYGLKRYQTGDIFECRSKFLNLPDLIFKRRNGLSFSFTGEKLTAEQVLIVNEQMQAEEVNFSLIPWQSKACYTLFIITHHTEKNWHQITTHFDQKLQELNSEYASKRKSARLELPTTRVMSFQEFVTFIKGDDFAKWESQFKFLPLYPYPKDPPACGLEEV